MSNVTSKPLGNRGTPRANPGKIGAIVAQFVSWLTTYWCVVWIMEPQPGNYALAIAVSIGAEVLLILMKSCLFNDDRSNDAIGWVGMVVDTVINAGGILPRAGRLLTFPPVAAILAIFGINAADPTFNNVGSFIVSVIAGALLAVLPHRLWRSGNED